MGTLIYPDPPVSEIYHQVAVQHGSSLSREQIGIRFSAAYNASECCDVEGNSAAESIHATSEEIERRRWRSIVSQVINDAADPQTCFDELFSHFARAGSWKCYPEVEQVLKHLKAAGYGLAIASNFDDRLTAIFRDHAALAPIDILVISSQVGFRKPSPHFYDALTNVTRVAREDILMVGDHLQNDFHGAQAAGLAALHLDRTRRGDIHSLAQVDSLLTVTRTGKHGSP